MVKNPTANEGDAGDVGWIPRLRRFPWMRAWHPTPICFPGESHGQRSLVGYSPQCHKEQDTIEACAHRGRNIYPLS